MRGRGRGRDCVICTNDYVSFADTVNTGNRLPIAAVCEAVSACFCAGRYVSNLLHPFDTFLVTVTVT